MSEASAASRDASLLVDASMIPTRHLPSLLLFFLAPALSWRQVPLDPEKYIREHYTKREVRIPMRDGARLFTAIYAPKDTSRKYPILITRTPYGVDPYGADEFKKTLGPSRHFLTSGYIFVYQDVRG